MQPRASVLMSTWQSLLLPRRPTARQSSSIYSSPCPPCRRRRRQTPRRRSRCGTLRDPDNVWPDDPGHGREVELLERWDTKPGCGYCRRRVPVGVATPPDPTPRTLEAVLPPGQPGVDRADVLIETEGASRPEHAASLGQGLAKIRNRAVLEAES